MKGLDRFSAWIGAAIIGGVIYFGVFKHATNPFLYLNFHALMLVVVGTMGVSILAFPLSKLGEILDFLLLGFFFRRKTSTRYEVAVELVGGIAEYHRNPEKRVRFQHPFVEEAFSTLVKKDLSSEQLVELLHDKKESIVRKYFDDAKILVAISKFPPALGLLGASTGMIEMMQQVGGAGGVAEIGKSMAVALVATFWGIGIANFVVLPLSDFALRQAEEALSLREMIIDTVYMAKKGYSPKHVFEHISSKLSLQDRIGLKELIRKTYVEVYGVPMETGTYNMVDLNKLSKDRKSAG